MEILFKVNMLILDKIIVTHGTSTVPELEEFFNIFDRVHISIDQSTRQTGIAIIDVESNKLCCLIDLINKGLPNYEIYMNMLKNFFVNNIKNCEVVSLTYEEPLNHTPHRYTKKVLHNLRNYIENDIKSSVDAFKNIEFQATNNRVWVSHYLKSPEYTNRKRKSADLKVCALEETLKRFPYTGKYLSHFLSPADSCDAVGLFYGTQEEVRAKHIGDKYIRINKTMQKGRLLKHTKAFVSGTVDSIIKQAIKFNRGLKLTIVEFNEKMSVEENINRWLHYSNDPVVIISADTKSQQLLKWECDKELKDNEYYAILVWRTV